MLLMLNSRDAMQHIQGRDQAGQGRTRQGRAGPGRAGQNIWYRNSMCVFATNKAKMFWDDANTGQAISNND